MSLEQIRRIKDVEVEAETIRKQGVDAAKNLLFKAAQQANGIVEDAKHNGEQSYQEAISKAEAEAQQTYDQIISDANVQCADLLSAANKQLDEAVSAIIRRVVKTSGNR